MLNARYSILDVRYWMFDTGCSILDTRCWMLSLPNRKLDIENSDRSTRHSALAICHLPFDTRFALLAPYGAILTPKGVILVARSSLWML